jgi:hypothetical protein
MPADDGAIMRAVQAAARAEQMQREAAQQHQGQPQSSTVEQHVDGLPGLSDRKRAFLKANPALLRQDIATVAGRQYQAALQAGIPDDTPEIERWIIDNTAREIEHHRELTSAHARPTPEHEAIAEAAADLQREAEEILAETAAAQPTPVVSPARRRMPISAPVSREVPSASGHRQPTDWNTLSAEERQIARHSFTDPGMSNAEKELLYLRNRQKLAQMRRDGSYSEQAS